jgi:[ribosomal protein S5]-alanine N-acetyltransferase
MVPGDPASTRPALRRPYPLGRPPRRPAAACSDAAASAYAPAVRAEAPSVETIRCDRVDLVSMSPDFLAALLAGRRGEAAELLGAAMPDEFPDAHDRGFLELRLGQMRKDPARQPLLVRAVVLRDDGRPLIGHAGFHGPPGVNGPQNPDALELGYTIFPPYRGRGFAREAAQGLIDWAGSALGVTHFVASVAPGNEPSLAIVRRLSFVQTGEQWDEEDGLELVWELHLDG